MHGTDGSLHAAPATIHEPSRSQKVGADGKPVRVDRAADLARSVKSFEELRAEFLTKMKLEARTVCELWFDTEDRDEGLKWLQDNYADINNGKLRDVSLPRQIDVLLPFELFKEERLEVTAVDTKGADKTAIRPDIRQSLDDPRTVTILCSRFNSAPDTSLRLLIKHPVDTGADRAPGDRVVLLVHSKEAFATKEDDGTLVETAEQGYAVKREKVMEQLAELTHHDIPVLFFNASGDPADDTIRALLGRIRSLRDSRVRRIGDVSSLARHLLEEHGRKEFREADREVRRRLAITVGQHEHLVARRHFPFRDLLAAVRDLHQRTVWASARRRGSWPNLDAYHYLGAGTAADADARSQEAFTALKALFEHMLGDTKLAAAHDFIRELQKSMNTWRERFVAASANAGRELYRSVLYPATILWRGCEDEYGLGSGYRDSVARQLGDWCRGEDGLRVLALVEDRMAREWQALVVGPLRELCGTPETECGAAA